MAHHTFRTARTIFDIVDSVRSASRIANALENGRYPNRRDLEVLGIDKIYSPKTWDVQNIRL
ncbi:hypothetical protein [Hoeflea prorocentri]|uniref:Uncharacterized protein n=1 Tax=Hoeflea prorocentri TaxID=1922333 RepID=A0A9X3ZI97_9HYPH|nr:hypothetical protein [Hoeflea prorocentri]MCY6381616.1 hypothetical protein [Hoeflea prorocentri]MDA5399416.1 hypothetical protein [Hoeflea prorocentri]